MDDHNLNLTCAIVLGKPVNVKMAVQFFMLRLNVKLKWKTDKCFNKSKVAMIVNCLKAGNRSVRFFYPGIDILSCIYIERVHVINIYMYYGSVHQRILVLDFSYYQ